MSKWRTAPCCRCRGYGVIGRGFDQLPDDCPDCFGRGAVCISPGGRIADYPGGPFRGWATEEELAAAKEYGTEDELRVDVYDASTGAYEETLSLPRGPKTEGCTQ